MVLIWWMTLLACEFANGPSGDADGVDVPAETSVVLTVQNQMTIPLVSFQYTQCGLTGWKEALSSPVQPGALGSSDRLPVACYDLLAVDSEGCEASFSTFEILEAGYEYTWVLYDDDMRCL